MNANSQGTVDPLDFTAVFEAGADSGPKVTFTVPTDVSGTRADIAGGILANQVKQATARLGESGLSAAKAHDLLAPAAELAEDSSYWREQSRGLVIFIAPGFHQATRIPIEVPESVTVADRFHLLPLVPVLESGGKCYILALAKNAVRLFDATRNGIEQLPLGEIPASFDDVIGELPEKSLQFRSVGGGDVAFHGQGSSSDTETMLTEKFIHAVGKAVGVELGTARSQPLVLASVAEYLPVFRKACPYPAIHDQVIAGNPEHTHADQLRSDAWRLLGDSVARAEAAERDHALSLVHAGKGSIDLAETAQAASEGRVDTIYLPRDDHRLVTPDAPALADRAILDAVRASGAVRTLGDWPGGEEVIAVFRY